MGECGMSACQATSQGSLQRSRVPGTSPQGPRCLLALYLLTLSHKSTSATPACAQWSGDVWKGQDCTGCDPKVLILPTPLLYVERTALRSRDPLKISTSRTRHDRKI